MRNQFTLLLIAMAALFLSGCMDEMVQVQVPPKAPVEGIRRIVVLPFDNFTTDPGLAREMEQRIIDALRESGWYDAVDSGRTSQAINPFGYSLEELKGGEGARNRLVQELRADAVIIGEATYYLEDVYLGPATCSACNSPTDIRWYVTQYTSVEVRMTAQMINLHTGEVVHLVRATGDDWDSYTQSIDWRESNPPAVSLLPGVNRQQVPQTRAWAINRAVWQFTQDLLPTFEWVPAF